MTSSQVDVGQTLFLRQGKTDEAIRILEGRWKGQLLKMGAESLGVAYARAGRREDAERVAAIATPAGEQEPHLRSAPG